MTDPTPTPTDPAPTNPPSDPAQDPTDWKAEAEKLKAEARKWETRSKENAQAAKRLSEIEESQKTDLQKALDRAEAAERRAAEFESAQQVDAWKTEIGAATGIAPAALRGSTKEEIEAHAEVLKPLLGAGRGPVVPTAANTPTTTPSDERAFARDLFGGS